MFVAYLPYLLDYQETCAMQTIQPHSISDGVRASVPNQIENIENLVLRGNGQMIYYNLFKND